MQDVPVRVEVERSGGFAGIVTRRRADTADLPRRRRRSCARSSPASTWRGSSRAWPGRAGTSCLARGADRFQYDVTVDDGERVHRFSVQDGSVPSELQPLLDAAMRLGNPA